MKNKALQFIADIFSGKKKNNPINHAYQQSQQTIQSDTLPFQKTSETDAIQAYAEIPQTIYAIDPDENVQTPKGAEINYLDAQALKFWDGKTTDFIIPQYYSQSAFGRNVGPARERLLSDGYLQLGGMDKNISIKTIPELKIVLSKYELKVSGKKSELVQRLMDNLSEDELSEIFPVGVYAITEKGRTALKPYSIIEVNDAYSLGFSYYKLLQEREKSPQDSDEDIIIRMLSQEIQDCYRLNDKSNYQLVLIKAAQFMEAVGEVESAFDCRILAFFMWAMDIKEYPQLKSERTSYFQSLHLEECGKNMGYSLGQVIERIEDVLKKNHPFSLTTPQNIAFTISLFKDSLLL